MEVNRAVACRGCDIGQKGDINTWMGCRAKRGTEVLSTLSQGMRADT